MNKTLLNFYGYNVFITDMSTESIIPRINQDFSYFLQSTNENDALSRESCLFIKINCDDTLVFSGISLGKTKLCKIKQATLKKRVFSYSASEDVQALALLIDDIKSKTFVLQTKNSDLAFEIAYLLILSSVGENLEARGLMRLHACSFLFNNKSFCFWGHRRAGKSTLTLSLMKLDDISIFSDENTLFDLNTNQILPFPTRMSVDIDTFHALLDPSSKVSFRQNKRFFLDDKLLVNIPNHKCAQPNALGFFYILDSRNGTNNTAGLNLKTAVLLFINIVFGVGIIQITEFFLRPTNLPILIKIFINRIRLFLKILRVRPQVWTREASLNENISYCANSILKR